MNLFSSFCDLKRSIGSLRRDYSHIFVKSGEIIKNFDLHLNSLMVTTQQNMVITFLCVFFFFSVLFLVTKSFSIRCHGNENKKQHLLFESCPQKDRLSQSPFSWTSSLVSHSFGPIEEDLRPVYQKDYCW